MKNGLKTFLYFTLLTFLSTSCNKKTKHYVTLSEYAEPTTWAWGGDEKYKIEATDRFKCIIYFVVEEYDTISKNKTYLKQDSLVWTSNEIGNTKIIELKKEKKYRIESYILNDPQAKFDYRRSFYKSFYYYNGKPKYDTISLTESINERYNWPYKTQHHE